jgi:hypothetical protein
LWTIYPGRRSQTRFALGFSFSGFQPSLVSARRVGLFSHQHFKINQRNISVRRVANFPEAAFPVEFIRANRVASKHVIEPD